VIVVIERSPSVQDIFGHRLVRLQTSNKHARERSGACKNGWVVIIESAEMQGVLGRLWHTVCFKLTWVSGAP